MATPQEIEIKFVVPDLKALARKLRKLGFHEETPSTHEINTLYDLPGQKLRRKGETAAPAQIRRQVEAHAQSERQAGAAQVARRIRDVVD